jgi:hypothetical protein
MHVKMDFVTSPHNLRITVEFSLTNAFVYAVIDRRDRNTSRVQFVRGSILEDFMPSGWALLLTDYLYCAYVRSTEYLNVMLADSAHVIAMKKGYTRSHFDVAQSLVLLMSKIHCKHLALEHFKIIVGLA